MEGSVRQSLLAMRWLTAGLLLVHGTYRLVTGGATGFGEFLTISHVPAGPLVAWLLTVAEIAGSLLILAGIAVRPLALWFAAELAAGIVLVHAREGWFVVGGGRNGMEYSVLMIGSFLAQAWAAPALSRRGAFRA